ncbi:MAG: TetR/AcrR family transcriptional regulator [Anaerolineaceae bacterium]|nr:TetR/AcrR family transcriptional regulator [Anaerolineaceae bacterium]
MDQSYNTKKKLGETLKVMMSEKPFDKISISELTKRCGVNRQTFYYHFETIIDLYNWVLAEEAGPLLEEFQKNPYNWKQAVLQILYFIRENHSAVLCALQSIENMQIRAFFYSYFKQIFSGMFDIICQGLDVDQEFKDFIITLHITGASGLALNWLENGMKQSPEQITDWLELYLGGNIRGTFERYDELKKNRK